MSTTLYIVRHGQSEGNINGDITGTNPPLTPKGIEQAEALADLVGSLSINQIISSHLIRAKQTAKIIASRKQLPVIEAPQIRERYFGQLEGVRGDDVSAKYQAEWIAYHNLPFSDQMNWRLVDDMESLQEVLDRTLDYFRSIRELDGQIVLAVTHANVMLALLAHCSFVKSFSQLPYGSIQNTAFIKLEQQAGSFHIAEVFGITKTS